MDTKSENKEKTLTLHDKDKRAGKSKAKISERSEQIAIIVII